jgi:hypothetical protein
MEQLKAFKVKTINKTIEHKINEWLNTYYKQCEKAELLTDEEKLSKNVLLEPIRKSIIVTGGAIASMLQGQLPNDFDIYFQDSEVLGKMVRNYLKIQKVLPSELVSTIEVRASAERVELFIQSAGVIQEGQETFDDYQYFEGMPEEMAAKYFKAPPENDKQPYVPTFMTSNAVSLSNEIQIITRFCGPVGVIHDNYDFVHCTNYWTYGTGTVLNMPALEAIVTKELKYVGSKYPICSMFRLRKFIERGWTINAGECLKIAWDISNLDLNKIEVLQDQLCGVDAAYWNEVLKILKQDSEKSLDRTYLFETISRAFDNM